MNSRFECPDCVFKKNHGGKSRQQVYADRQKEKAVEKGFERVQKKNKLKPKNVDQIALDEKTYEQVFLDKPNWCEECELRGIKTMLSPRFRNEKGAVIAKWQYSHILTKAAYPEFRNDRRNFNRLCFHHHQVWEFGDRETMMITPLNQKIIDELLSER